MKNAGWWNYRDPGFTVGPSDKFFEALKEQNCTDLPDIRHLRQQKMNTTHDSEKAERNTLYIVMRTDMDSMNAGKAMAQAAHAGQLAEKMLTSPEDATNVFNEECGFMTTIVLDGHLDDVMEAYKSAIEMTSFAGLVEDPTYPIKDGLVTHHVPVVTCCWSVIFEGDEIPPILKNLHLHR